MISAKLCAYIFFIRKIDGALGYGDPRAIKEHLSDNGIKCWIDVERVGKVDIFIFSFE